MRKRRNPRLLAVPVAMSLLMGHGSFPANAGETIAIEKTFESNANGPDEAKAQFTDIYAQEGRQYRLAGVETEVLGSRPEVDEQAITIDQEGYYNEDEALANGPLAEIEQEGVAYYLTDAELVSLETGPRTQYGKATITYKGVGYIDELPELGDVEVIDGLTGKSHMRKLPRTGHQVTAEYWKDDFTFPVTIYGYDADSYALGDVAVPKGADLSQYGDEFLRLLGLSPDHYQVNSVTLQGEPYEQDGELVQDAAAHGKRRTVDVAATFEGSVTIPAEQHWHYRCTYSNIQPGTDIATLYTIRATATYEAVEETLAEAKKTFWEQLVDLVANPITIAVLLILTFTVMCLMLIKRKKKKEKAPVTYVNSPLGEGKEKGPNKGP